MNEHVLFDGKPSAEAQYCDVIVVGSGHGLTEHIHSTVPYTIINLQLRPLAKVE
jgi:hypothetical protein